MEVNMGKRLERLAQSEIRIMSIECEKVNGINLSQGICDLDLPEPLASGAKNAIDTGINHYTRYDGLAELRKSIAGKMLDYNRISADPEKNIIVSAGATGAFYSACAALLNPGDEVILFEPYYGYHEYTLLAVGAVPVYAELCPPEWSFDMASLESLVTQNTRGIMINTPANPSGKVFSLSEMNLLADFCIRHDLIIFTDEIYEYIVYDGRVHISPGALPGIAGRVVTISGYSKTFSITGWRIGYCVCEEKWARMIGYANDLVYVCAPAPLQSGVSEAINKLSGSDYYKNLCGLYNQKRKKLCSVLKDIGLTPYIPQGAYYILADAGALPGKTSKEKAMFLLNDTGVAAVPGSAFYCNEGGENLLRFCFAKSESILDEACDRLLKIKL